MEAARLMLRGKESDYAAARKRAARWLSRRKINASDMPSAAEIQTQLYALSGLFAAEHQAASLAAMRAAALELMTVLSEYDPHISGSAIDGSVIAGALPQLELSAETVACLDDNGRGDVEDIFTRSLRGLAPRLPTVVLSCLSPDEIGNLAGG